jgi:hypothetical protein
MTRRDIQISDNRAHMTRCCIEIPELPDAEPSGLQPFAARKVGRGVKNRKD